MTTHFHHLRLIAFCAASWLGAAMACAAESPPIRSAVTPAEIDAARSGHWSYQPVVAPKLPVVKGVAWCRTPVDRFVLARLEAAGIAPSPEADRRTLLRRLSFDLIGLPPTAEEVEKFVSDKSPDAYEKQVERLLASPAYGPRWARHWLDVARYADTAGYVFTAESRYPFAYTYRDYVIRAFNSDLPFDRFILEQIAADQLDLGADKRPLAAMGFLTVGRRFSFNIHDITDDRIDVVSRGLMGLTLQCARCHDHKYDALPTTDYYALYGIFRGSEEPGELPQIETPPSSPEQAAFQAELDKRRKEKADFVATFNGRKPNQGESGKIHDFEKRINSWLIDSPQTPPRAMVMHDADKPFEAHVLLRGNPDAQGPAVPHRFLTVLRGVAGDKPFTRGSGRLELAQAIASPRNPLTPRVMVNRIWQHHFGAGLVRTPSDFGVRGEPPTHPELLDWLAARFIQAGWSVKAVHRLIVCSAAYRQQSAERSAAAAVDVENRLLWRMNRQRLEWESMRDAILAVAGRLDQRVGGRSSPQFTRPFSTRRAIYATIDRQDLPETVRNFDFPSSEESCPGRPVTMVPQQALFMLNNAFVMELTKAVAERPEVRGEADPAKRITAIHRLVLGRSPETTEMELSLQYVAAGGPDIWSDYAHALLMSNEFMFVD